MDKKVKLEQLNGKLVLPVPFKENQVGQEYSFAEADLKNPELMELKPVGKERWFDDDNI